MPQLAFWFFWGFAWCFLVALLLRWTWEADLATAGLVISLMAWEVRCSQLLQLDPLPTWRWRSAPNENMKKHGRFSTPQFGFPLKFRWNSTLQENQLAVFKWTKATFRQRFLKRLSSSFFTPKSEPPGMLATLKEYAALQADGMMTQVLSVCCGATNFASEELSTTPSRAQAHRVAMVFWCLKITLESGERYCCEVHLASWRLLICSALKVKILHHTMNIWFL